MALSVQYTQHMECLASCAVCRLDPWWWRPILLLPRPHATLPALLLLSRYSEVKNIRPSCIAKPSRKTATNIRLATHTHKRQYIYLIIGMKNKKIIRRDKTSFIQVMFTHTMKVWGDGVKRIAWVIINRFTQAATVCTRQHGNTTLCNLQHQLPLLLCRYDNMIRFYFLISTVREHDIRLWVLRESFHLVITGFVKKRNNNPC